MKTPGSRMNVCSLVVPSNLRVLGRVSRAEDGYLCRGHGRYIFIKKNLPLTVLDFILSNYGLLFIAALFLPIDKFL